MFQKDRDHIDILIGIVVVAAVIAMLMAVARGRSGSPRVASSMAVDTNAELQTAAMPVSIQRLQPAEPTLQRNIIATVFECEIQGQRVLSDQPCGEDAVIRRVSAPNRMQAQDTSNLYSPVRQSRSSGAAGEVMRPNATVCASIEQQIKSIDARMRRKYTNPEGEYFRGRLRVLREQRWDAGCRWLKPNE